MTTPEIRITGFSIKEKSIGDKGSFLLGYFDCQVRGIELQGCSLIRTPKAGFNVSPPVVQDQRGLRAVYIIDQALRHALMEAARATYKALGGEHGDWTPRAAAQDEGEGVKWLKN